MELSIECSKRKAGINPRALRREGLLPAVLYGHNGAESVSLTVQGRDAERLVRFASVNNTLINVSVPEMPWSGKALLREVQTHPWKGNLYHLSFFSVAAQDSVEVVVPIHYNGTPKGVKDEGGTLDVIVSELAIRCAPASIPETLEVDVTDLVVGSNLHISDLKLPAGVEVVTDTDKTLVTLLQGRTAAQADEAEGAAESVAEA
ncbi:MAG: 50S ribosomal protein L25/general stress protein Ctc [Leptolyngbya sp. SIO1E4]|nr:50S ribosomal protein L25/general stress protein Ctc [Leptolyngbya sp. SIO1E4]